jgi:hypothetical protein
VVSGLFSRLTDIIVTLKSVNNYYGSKYFITITICMKINFNFLLYNIRSRGYIPCTVDEYLGGDWQSRSVTGFFLTRFCFLLNTTVEVKNYDLK